MKIYNFTQKHPTDNSLKIIRNKCIHCGEDNRIYVEPNAYLDWSTKARFVQHIWPTLSLDDREIIVSGTHPPCWAEMWPDDDE
jgi:hypothetical protein